MKAKIFSLFGLCLIFFSCATAPAPRQIQNSFPLEKSFDTAWQAVIEVFGELTLPIMNMEKASGLITTDWIAFGLRTGTLYADCGKAGLFDIDIDRLGRFNVYVKKISETSCEIIVNSKFEKSYHGYKDPTVFRTPCVSTGRLEAEIFKKIQEKIK
jgi:uncharacterized lipoprotein